MARCVAEQSRQRNIPWLTDAHVGRVLGQSKQSALSRTFFSLRNCSIFAAVGTQIWPFPAAVTVPSLRMFPDVCDLYVRDDMVAIVCMPCEQRSEPGRGTVGLDLHFYDHPLAEKLPQSSYTGFCSSHIIFP